MRRQNNILLTISLVWTATIAGAMIFVTADDSNFVHDIVGIECHLNRQRSNRVIVSCRGSPKGKEY